MCKFLFTMIACCLVLLCQPAYSQERKLEIKRFEYSWTHPPGTARAIILQEAAYQKQVAAFLAKALAAHYNVEVSTPELSVKKLNAFALAPRFRTELKELQSGTLYAFVQFFEQFAVQSGFNDGNPELFSKMEVKCRVLDGADGSVILNRDITFSLLRERAPAGQVLLEQMCSTPEAYVSAFDSMTARMLDTSDIASRDLIVPAACVFTGKWLPDSSLAQLEFVSSRTSIRHMGEPPFSLYPTQHRFIKTKERRNRGGNIASGAVSLVTGVGFNKSKSADYEAVFPFAEAGDSFQCVIHYRERVTAERSIETTRDSDGSKWRSVDAVSDYGYAERNVNREEYQYIVLKADTLARFTLEYTPFPREHLQYSQYWNGTDTATRGPLPQKWNNHSEDVSLTVWGKLRDIPFRMQTSSELQVKHFYMEEQLVLVMVGKDFPVRALQYRSLTPEQLKAFTMLASLPYSYFQGN